MSEVFAGGCTRPPALLDHEVRDIVSNRYLISIDRLSGEEGQRQMDALLRELHASDVAPDRVDKRHSPPHWISVTLPDVWVNTLILHYPGLIIGDERTLSF